MASSSETREMSFDNGEPPPMPARPASLSADGALAIDLATFPRASFRDRAAAAILDLVVVLIAVQLLEPVFSPIRNDEFRGFLFWLLAYDVGFWTTKATTVGGIICQLRVIRTDGARRFDSPTPSCEDWQASSRSLGGRPWLPLDPQGSGSTGLARQDRRHLRRQSAPWVAALRWRSFSLSFDEPSTIVRSLQPLRARIEGIRGLGKVRNLH